MKFDQLTKMLYQENINWVYSIIKELDTKGVERKEKFIQDPYLFNNIVVLGYYFNKMSHIFYLIAILIAFSRLSLFVH